MERFEKLKSCIASYPNAAIAYSGGLDSSVLLRATVEVRPDVLAVTYYSDIHPGWEKENASSYAQHLKVNHISVTSDILAITDISLNLPTRCYYCKRMVYKYIKQVAEDHGCKVVHDGSNADDYASSIPGVRAAREIGIISPIAQCGLTKQDVRELAELLAIPESNRKTYACLASRMEVGERLTSEKLHMIEAAERLVHQCGYEMVRVRMHGYLASIELPKAKILPFMNSSAYEIVCSGLLEMGFDHVCVDLSGYTS